MTRLKTLTTVTTNGWVITLSLSLSLSLSIYIYIYIYIYISLCVCVCVDLSLSFSMHLLLLLLSLIYFHWRFNPSSHRFGRGAQTNFGVRKRSYNSNTISNIMLLICLPFPHERRDTLQPPILRKVTALERK